MKYVLKEDLSLTRPFTLPAYFDGPVTSIENLLGYLKRTNPEKAEQFVAKKEVFVRMLAGYLARQARKRETQCRVLGCAGSRRGSRKCYSGRKTSRGAQLFCGAHSGLTRAIGNDNCKKLSSSPNLRVVVFSD